MVIGNGLMAKAFFDYKDNPDITIFASGVSDSTALSSLEFERERQLLLKTLNTYPNSKLVYFSTCSINDKAVKERPYVMHKLELEQIIKEHTDKYLIFRVSNVVGPKGNANTIMNYLVNAVKNNIVIDIWKHAERNLIDIDNVKIIVDEVLQNEPQNKIVNVAARESLLVSEILDQIEIYFNKKARTTILDKGNALHIDVSDISITLVKIESIHGSGLNYINNLLEKYY